jgi:hypothetical protein
MGKVWDGDRILAQVGTSYTGLNQFSIAQVGIAQFGTAQVGVLQTNNSLYYPSFPDSSISIFPINSTSCRNLTT